MKCSAMLRKGFIVDKSPLASFTTGLFLMDRDLVLFQAFFINKFSFTSLTVIVPLPMECSPMLAQGLFIDELPCTDLTIGVDPMKTGSVFMQCYVIEESQLASLASLCVDFNPMLSKCVVINKSTVALLAIAMSGGLLMSEEPG